MCQHTIIHYMLTEDIKRDAHQGPGPPNNPCHSTQPCSETWQCWLAEAASSGFVADNCACQWPRPHVAAAAQPWCWWPPTLTCLSFGKYSVILSSQACLPLTMSYTLQQPWHREGYVEQSFIHPKDNTNPHVLASWHQQWLPQVVPNDRGQQCCWPRTICSCLRPTASLRTTQVPGACGQMAALRPSGQVNPHGI